MMIKEKILISIPVLYSEIIYDHLNDSVRNRNEFIIKAVEEKFTREEIKFIAAESNYDKDTWLKEVEKW